MSLLLVLAGCRFLGVEPVEADTAAFGIVFRAPERYIVVKGDTLGKIAAKYNVTLQELRDSNGSFEGDTIEIGQELIVWPGKKASGAKRSGAPRARTATMVLDSASVAVARGPAPQLRRAGVLGALDADASVAAHLADGDVDELTGSVNALQASSAHGIGTSSGASTGIHSSSAYDDGRWLVADNGGPVAAAPGVSSARVVAPKLALPAARACLAGPTGNGLGDDGMVSSVGLSLAQVQKATRGFLPQTTGCVPDGAGSVRTEITVGCNGRVSDVSILGSDGLSAASVSCIEKTLYFTPFPAHDLPDGFTFQLPINFFG